MKEIALDETKKIQLNILSNIVAFCETKNINYFLIYGTLLGSIRHKGYIPWDDDIDIAMMREEFEKFIKEYEKEQQVYKLYYFKIEKKYPYPFIKISDTRTILVEDSDLEFNKLGVNIDIFPIDYLPEHVVRRKMMFLKVTILRYVWFLKSIPLDKRRCFHKNLILFLGKKAFSYICIETIVEKIIKESSTYSKMKSMLVANLVWGEGEREIMNRKIYTNIRKGTFENDQYNIPQDYHQYLTRIYGNYMQLPDEKERVSHHRFSAYWK